MNGPKIYFTIPLFGGIPITQTTVSSFAVMLLLCIAGVVLGSNLQKRPSRRQRPGVPHCANAAGLAVFGRG